MSDLQKLRARQANTKHGHRRPISKEYRTWHHILGRCNNPKDAAFKNYGGRGVRVHDSWNDFSRFLLDVGHSPTPEHSLDRINNDGNYEPGNVRWVLRKEQSRNTRRNIKVRGMCLKDACELAGVSYDAAQARIRRKGQSPEMAISELESKLPRPPQPPSENK